MEELLEKLCHKYGFLIYDESVPHHRRPDEHAMNALTEAYLAGEKSRLELLRAFLEKENKQK